MTTTEPAAPTALDGHYGSWMRSMRARNLAPATIKTYATGARQFLDWLAANAPEVTTPEQGRLLRLAQSRLGRRTCSRLPARTRRRVS